MVVLAVVARDGVVANGNGLVVERYQAAACRGDGKKQAAQEHRLIVGDDAF